MVPHRDGNSAANLVASGASRGASAPAGSCVKGLRTPGLTQSTPPFRWTAASCLTIMRSISRHAPRWRSSLVPLSGGGQREVRDADPASEVDRSIGTDRGGARNGESCSRRFGGGSGAGTENALGRAGPAGHLDG